MTLEQDQVLIEDRVQELSETVSLKLPDVGEEKTCDVKLEAPRKPSIKSVSLETPLVTEEGLIQFGKEKVETEIESSFKLKPGKKKSLVDESITLDQPESVTSQQEDLTQEVSLFCF